MYKKCQSQKSVINKSSNNNDDDDDTEVQVLNNLFERDAPRGSKSSANILLDLPEPLHEQMNDTEQKL